MRSTKIESTLPLEFDLNLGLAGLDALLRVHAPWTLGLLIYVYLDCLFGCVLFCYPSITNARLGAYGRRTALLLFSCIDPIR